MGRRLAALALLLATVAGCASGPEAPPPGGGVSPVEPPLPPALTVAELPGWADEDHLAGFRAYVAGCGAAREDAARRLCARARARAPETVTPSGARAFLEDGFTVVAARTPDGGPGLLTSYFAPEYAARRVADAEFDAPVLATPADLVRDGSTVTQRRADGTTGPYPDRAAIQAAPPGAPLAWMRAEELFFMQLQGSGYLTFGDGGRARAGYAADNGQPFVGIARPMAERGILPADQTSGEGIRAWLAAHRGPEARDVMALNPRYSFFRLDPDDGGDPPGAAGVPLPARRAIAVDPAHWRYGDLVWISADAGALVGARSGYRGLVMALDTGTAIRGPVRADFYMGRGPAAGAEAGSVRHPLRMWRLVPKD